MYSVSVIEVYFALQRYNFFLIYATLFAELKRKQDKGGKNATKMHEDQAERQAAWDAEEMNKENGARKYASERDNTG